MSMQFGDDISQKKCARCYQKLDTTSILYRDGMWWHQKCYHEGSRMLANAERISNVLSTPPELYIHITLTPP